MSSDIDTLADDYREQFLRSNPTEAPLLTLRPPADSRW